MGKDEHCNRWKKISITTCKPRELRCGHETHHLSPSLFLSPHNPLFHPPSFTSLSSACLSSINQFHQSIIAAVSPTFFALKAMDWLVSMPLRHIYASISFLLGKRKVGKSVKNTFLFDDSLPKGLLRGWGLGLQINKITKHITRETTLHKERREHNMVATWWQHGSSTTW